MVKLNLIERYRQAKQDEREYFEYHQNTGVHVQPHSIPLALRILAGIDHRKLTEEEQRELE